jgi:glycogen(starch) synthase
LATLGVREHEHAQMMTTPSVRSGGSPSARRRVLMLSWEYPPVMVGGLGRHVHALATSLAAAGHEVTVVTRHAPGAALEEYAEGVRIVRAPEDPPAFPLATPSLLAWTMAFNHTLTRAALRAASSSDGFDVIHAHDWLVTHAAVTLKEHLDLPLVATIHATEAGRHQGWLPEEMNKTIHSVEWWLASEACRVIVCSEYMRWEVGHLLDLPAERMTVVPNGVEPNRFRAAPEAVASARAAFAGDGPLVTFAGRLVYEKGVQDLIASLPVLRRKHPRLRVVIAGDGPYRGELEAAIDRHDLRPVVTLPGFLNEQLPAVMAASDCFAVPSIYEPFGMVALEGAAAGAPLAVASTGGLAEIVQPGVTGMTFPAKNPDALAHAIDILLTNNELARSMAERAQVAVQKGYNWSTIAQRTAGVYGAAMAQSAAFDARHAEAQLAGGRSRLVVPEGNLLARAA